MSTIGKCQTCQRCIPAGYLAIATKYKTVNYGKPLQSFKIAKPVELFCQECNPQPVLAKKTKVQKATAQVVKVPKAVGSLPYKVGSTMRVLFEKALNGGLSDFDLKQIANERGADWRLQRKCILSGRQGNNHRSTHTWTVEMRDGMIMVKNVVPVT